MRVLVDGARLYFDVDGVGLAYEDGALVERPPLLLIHGGPGYDHLVFKPYFARFADVAQVLYLDLRGHGRSDPGEPADWHLRRWGDDVLGVIDALGLEDPILLGVSFGGYVALDVATRRPDRLGKLVLASTGAWPNLDAATEAFREVAGAAAAKAHDVLNRDPSIEHFIAYERHCTPHYNTTPQGPSARLHTELNVPLLASWLAREGSAFDYRPGLANVTCPTLVLCGDADPVTPVAESQDMAARLPDARLVVLPGCGHGPWRDDPDAAERALREFIAAD